MSSEAIDVQPLEPFVGDWSTEADFTASGGARGGGRTSFEWLLGRRFLLQRAEADHPDAPDGLMVITPADGGVGNYVQHYFDSRGVVRLYEMGFDGHTWTLTRRARDFSPLHFAQRFVGTFSADGTVIDGRWETSHDGGDWSLDFRLTYRRRP